MVRPINSLWSASLEACVRLSRASQLAHPALCARCRFVVFYVYSAWALLAVMTGVVSENMIAIREQMVQDPPGRRQR